MLKWIEYRFQYTGARVQMVKFWCRLSVDDDLPVYLREAYLLAKNQRLDWYNS